MPDDFKPARVAAQPKIPPAAVPPPAPTGVEAAVTHLLAFHEQLAAMLEHIGAVIPAAGIGMQIAALRTRLQAARDALFPPPPPEPIPDPKPEPPPPQGPQPDHS